MQTATGVIIAVQEGRFRLALPDGRSVQFVLSSHAPLDPQDLPALAAAERPVTVHFEAGPHLDTRMAHKLTTRQPETRS